MGAGLAARGSASRRPHRPHAAVPRRRPLLFALGDAGFLLGIGVLATLIMWLVHQTDWPLVFMMIAGMTAAMLAQMLVCWAATPLLGSIETMVPAMIVAMLSPMAVCTLHMIGCEVSARLAAGMGAAWGLGLFLLLQRYAVHVRRSLRRAYPAR